MITVNVKENHPTVEEALRLFHASFSLALRQKEKAFKIIHGYGSGGQGGAIRQAVRRELVMMEQKGLIKNYCWGEDFHFGSLKAADFVKAYPMAKKDRDFGKQNDGISLVLLR